MDDEVPSLVSQDLDDLAPELAPIDITVEHKSKVPITVITGFLGSGKWSTANSSLNLEKTTLLKYVLHTDHGKRIAVVQNEFGEEIGLERAVAMGKFPKLVDLDENGEEKPSPIQEWLELPNGCICCTAKDNLVLALENLVEKRDRFDYIFVETTGMADPGPLIKTLWVDEEIGSSIYLDAVITLVDAHLILNHLKGDAEQSHQISTYQPRKLEAMRQIALADVILINKIDLVDEAKLVEVKEALEDINLLCPKLLTQRSVVPLDSIMQINAFDGNKLVPSLAIFESAHHHHHHHHEEHRDCSGEDSCSLASQKPHSEGVTTIVIKVDGDVKSTDAVSIWFGDLLWEQKLPLYRIKGELAVDSNPHRFIVQGVHDNFEIIPTEFAWSEHLPQPTMTTGGHSLTETEKGSCTPPIIRRNTLVFIGQNLDPQAIKQSFINACLKQ